MARSVRLAGIVGAMMACAPLASANDVPAGYAGVTDADIHVLGEVHDNPAHHLRQAAIISQVSPVALVFEMLTPQQAAEVQDMPRDDAGMLGDALGWDDTGWPDFAMYHPIFAAAPQALIYGAAVDGETLTTARTQGAAAAFGPDAARFGLVPLDADEQAAREAEQAAAHCDMLPEDLLAGMVEVQRMRDAHFARVALDAFDATGGPVAVITGNGHARTDIGIPAYIGAARPDVAVVALGQFEDEPGVDVPFDITAVSPGPDRADPCDAFR